MNLARFAALAALSVAIAACGDATTTTAASTSAAVSVPKSQPVSMEAILKTARGFEAGSLMSTRRVFVLFDPQCPHCGRLWAETKSLRADARFTWVPVAMMRPVSAKQGAALLEAANPVALMDSHEALLTAGKGGTTGVDPSPELLEALQKNTALLMSFGARSVPYIVGTHAVTGEIVTISGALPAADLAARLGWTSPAMAAVETVAK